LGPLGTAATNRPIVSTPGDYDEGEIGGMLIGRGNRSTLRKPAPVPLRPPQIPHAAPDANPGRLGWNISALNFMYLLYLKHLFRFLLRVNYIRIVLKNVILVQLNSIHTSLFPGRDCRLNFRKSYKDIIPTYIFCCRNHVVTSVSHINSLNIF
jgi:hypothetical protein